VRAALILCVATLAGCIEGDPPPLDDPCSDSLRGSSELLADGFQGTEGITFSPDGRMFAGDRDVLTEVRPDGSWSVVADVPGVIGLTWWRDRVVAATSDSGDGDDLDGVFFVAPDTGDVERIGPGLEGANFVTVTPWDTLIVSDPDVDRLFELTAEGDVSVWLDGVESPNGTAFDEDGSVLWVATTYANPAPIRRVEVAGEAAGAVEDVASFEAGITPDGVAVGAGGDLYVAQIVAGRIDVVTDDGASSTLSGAVGAPASVAFGVGDDWDACSIYSTSLFSDEMYRTEVGETGLRLR